MSQQHQIPPWMAPWFMGHGPDHHANDVPARVQVALSFLNSLTAKTAPVCGVSDVSGLETDVGQELCPEEEATRDTALCMLQDYFRGRMAPSDWEQFNATMTTHMFVDCPQCKGENRACKVCLGKGKIIVPKQH